MMLVLVSLLGVWCSVFPLGGVVDPSLVLAVSCG